MNPFPHARFLGAAVALLTGLLAAPAALAQVPAPDARPCVSASAGGDQLVFRNNCGTQVYVVWCGDLKYSKKRCGEGPQGGFFTHSTNLDPGARHSTDIKGAYRYGACPGRIGFGNRNNYEDLGGGTYRCLARGG